MTPTYESPPANTGDDTPAAIKGTARVVVVGGGIFGVSALYHLVKEGWSDVVLCEKGELTSGSTWHAASQCPNFIGSYNYAVLHEESIRLYKSLEEETGLSAGFHACGGIRLALCPEEVDWFHHVQGISRNVGFDMELIGPDEIKKIHPFVNTEGVILGAWTKNDGHLDPSGTTQAMARAARNGGAVIYRRNRVTDIKQRTGGEWEVVTEQGSILCEHVVNAAGCYGPQINAMVGVKTPYVNMIHAYVVTENIPEIEARSVELPVLRDPWSSNYIRQEGNGILVGAYETANAKTIWDDGADWELENPLFDADFDAIAQNLERAAERVPLFGQGGMKRTVCGAITHTPDSSFLGGPTGGLRNFWQFCGTSIGVSQGGGAGKFIAQWMVHGQPDLNTREFDPRRYGDWACGSYARDKSIEEYEMMYTPGIPGLERMAGRPVKTTPIYEKLKAKGAVFQEVFGWERAKYYSIDSDNSTEQPSFRRNNSFPCVARECAAVRDAVGIADLTAFTKYEITGDDAATFLGRLSARSLPNRDGGVVLAHFLNDSGRIVSEATITRLNATRYFLASAIVAQIHDHDWLTQHMKDGEDVRIDDITDETAMLLLTGPKARSVLEQVTDANLATDSFPWLSAQEITVAGIQCLAVRVSYAGELGWELYHPIKNMDTVFDALMDAGKEWGITPFGSYAMNCMRLEKAYKAWGAELTTEITPVEADIMRFVAMKRNDFKGKDAVTSVQESSPAIRCVYLLVDADDTDCRGNEPIMAGDTVVGLVTSGGYAHRCEASLAFAYIEAQVDVETTALCVEILGDRRPVKVLDAPLYDPMNERLKS